MNEDGMMDGGTTPQAAPAAEPEVGNTLLGGGPEASAPEGAAQQAAPAQAGAPEQYEAFTLPEGIDAGDERVQGALAEAGGVFRELGLNQAQAQKLVDLHMKHWMGGAVEAEERFEEEVNRRVKRWGEQVKGDPEFGGIHLDESVAQVRRAISNLGGQRLYDALNKETGIINHPAVFAAFARMGRFFSEDKFARGRTDAPRAAGNSPEDIAARFYPDMVK